MSRYTDIELTSQAPDGSWTWRAAGARQPRGTLSGDLVPAGGRVGDVVRAEVESGLDGVEVVSVSAPKIVRRNDEGIQRIEVVGAPRPEPGVVVSLARGSRTGERNGRTGERERGPRRDGGPAPRRDRAPGPRREGPPGPRREGPPGPRREERAEGDGTRRPREDARRGAGRPAGAGRDEGRRGAGRPAGAGRDEDSRGPRTDGPPTGQRRDRRPTVSAAHRNAALAKLRPEQLPVAEQLLRGGIPAVRQAIEEQNTAAKAAGLPEISPDAFMNMAEELLPVMNLAGWMDRATAAQNAGRTMRLRELRAVVAASRTVSLDDEGRVLARALQDSLTERVTSLRDEWQQRIDAAIDGGKVLEALQLSARPPEAATRCPAELAVRLAASASAAMTSEIAAADWLALLAAVLESPVRRTVRPTGIPDDDQAKQAARRAAGSVPELAKLIGLPIPPPPPRRPPVPARALSRASGGGSTAGP
jgi:hypothetical protein